MHRFPLALWIALASAVSALGQVPLGFPTPLDELSRERPSDVVRLPPVDAEPAWNGPAQLNPLLLDPGPAATLSPSEPSLSWPEGMPPPALAPLPLVEDEPPPIKLWQGGVELGLNGASGNNESFDFRFAANARRRTVLDALTLRLDYFRQTQESADTANRLFHDWRLEHFFLGRPWTCYVHGTVEYDEFAAFDTRATADVGVGYRFFENERTFLIGRCGAGASREFGGPQDEVVPEAVFGVDFQHRIGIRHRLVAATEYMPDVTEFSHFRINSQAAWEFLLDEKNNLSLKLSVLDRYTSTPHGKRPNDLNYGVVLLWKF